MLRITFKELNRQMQHVINNRFVDLSKLQNQLATGKRLQRPSDDPVDVANALNLRTKVTQLQQFSDNIKDGMAFMSITDTTMLSMNSLFQRLRELAVQGSNDTLSADERRFILKEVEQLFRQFINLSNTLYKGDYIFGGTQTKIAPFPLKASLASDNQNYANMEMAYYDGSAGVGVATQLRDAYSGNPITRIIPGTFRLRVGAVEYIEGVDFTLDYVTGMFTPLNAALAVDVSEGGLFGGGPNGYYALSGFRIEFEYVSRGTDIYGDQVVSSGDVLREIEPGVVVPINITADEIIYDSRTGTNALDAVVRFGQNLLQNNRAGVQTAIGEIDNIFTTILSAQSKNGARINRFETTLERNELQTNEATRLLSELEDADFAEAASKYALLQTVYEAALKSAARVIQPSLVNYI